MAQRTSPAAGLSFLQDLPLTQQALEFARERHENERRASDGASFLVHPLEVASLLDRSRYPDPVVAAGVLHDVLENTNTAPAELESRFGSEVAGLVAAVSDDPTIADEERQKDETRDRVRKAGPSAQAVYGADKVSKVRELRMLISAGIDREQVAVKERRYRKSLEMLEQTMPGNRIVEVLRFELEALAELPPQPNPQ